MGVVIIFTALEREHYTETPLLDIHKSVSHLLIGFLFLPINYEQSR